MFLKAVYAALIYCCVTLAPSVAMDKVYTISSPKITMTLDYGNMASITSLVVNGQKVISSAYGIYTSVRINGVVYSSLRLKTVPALIKTGNTIKLTGITYGDKNLSIKENWIFTIAGKEIKWNLERTCSKPVVVEESALPVFNFDSINTWEGAYQGYGGLAWFYLFNEKLCTYGVHTRSSDFWNSKTGNGLNITVNAAGKNVAMKYSRTNDDKLAYTVSVSGKELAPKMDSGTNRRRFIRGRTDVWAPFTMPAGISSQTITLSYFDFNEKYGRGTIKGLDGKKVNAVLNTIARIGVIDSLHFGGNSWHTPYGPICLHEQYIAQLGLGINDPKYLAGYQSCLDFYCSHAIKPGGRVYPRWAYTNEDAMPGKFNQYGFYEAQWGILMDSNPDLVTNIAELYDMTGDKAWVKSHQLDCEKALDWILKRDGNHNGLVEMTNDNSAEKKSSDWIDIIWASYENAFVNAKLYHALVKWAAIEHQLNNRPKAKYYADFAAKLKESFNKPTSEGGFWDEEKGCYIHWRDKDETIHGTNMVTPVNFMAIAYGICDDGVRKKIILNSIETQMEKEKLFFWPLAMTSYAPGEGKEWQFPFPSYENGDLFLSWGSVGVAAYAAYNPALALKYVKNVLDQYGKDGLAFQRYGRLKQDGLGDDILSGNSLSIVGLYQAIYGINPLYNRFYLDPHITSELAGTVLKYNFRGKKLDISLGNNNYSVADKMFKVTAPSNFGFYTTKNRLSYFNGNSPDVSLQAASVQHLAITIGNWAADKIEWQQSATRPVSYVVHQLKPNSSYSLMIDGKLVKKIKSDPTGNLILTNIPGGSNRRIAIQI
ncbi:trehalase family glycosidase [Mucilaginibacter sp.]|jgi:hypothetical protein|uniref:alpha-L-rhamnosidase-related protein n=1 Tax=Mucilaginibacter sp. TaxID=1882438 RepID=UPI002C90EA4B|nr:hypothetical protein [Mucilaginibacter sp.]HTI59859.1 hypothetical protein [Mucilaginibacter sp.]